MHRISVVAVVLIGTALGVSAQVPTTQPAEIALGPSDQVRPFLTVALDGKTAIMTVGKASPETPSAIQPQYLLVDLGTGTGIDLTAMGITHDMYAKVVGISSDSRYGLIMAAGRQSRETVTYLLDLKSRTSTKLPVGQDVASVWAGDRIVVSGFRKELSFPKLMTPDLKETKTLGFRALVVGASRDGQVLLGIGNPENLTDKTPLKQGPRSMKVMLISREGKVLKVLGTTEETSENAVLSPTGKYAAVMRQVPSSAPTGGSGRSVFVTNVQSGRETEIRNAVMPIALRDDGLLVGMRATSPGQVSVLTYDVKGAEKTLVENALCAGATDTKVFFAVRKEGKVEFKSKDLPAAGAGGKPTTRDAP